MRAETNDLLSYRYIIITLNRNVRE